MSDPSILFVKPKTISTKDKKVLQGAGVIVVEIDDPASVKFVRAGTELDSSEMLMAACQAISKSSWDEVRVRFARAICAAVESAKRPSPLSVER